MLINSTNYRDRCKVGVRFKIMPDTHSYTVLRHDIQAHVQSAGTFRISEVGTHQIAYTWIDLAGHERRVTKIGWDTSIWKIVGTAMDLSNKGAIKCWKCSCPTEMRRDFADMTVREFCPRCKI